MTTVEELSHDQVQKLINTLQQFVTPGRLQKFQTTLQFRTRHLTIVLEDIFQPHNASAVLRTCDCFGIQDVHIIENRNKYQVNPDVALGASKWLSLATYHDTGNNTAACLRSLKAKGYRIVATTPHKDDYTPDTLPLNQKTALVFGTELEGLSQTALDLADAFVKIPMVGFTESLNISVSAAIFMQNMTTRIRTSDLEWQLTDAEKSALLLSWLLNSVKHSEEIIRRITG